MTRDDEPKYYNDPDYVDPFVKGWQRYREAVGRLYARIDPDIPVRIGVRIRSFFVVSLCFAFAAIMVLESATDFRFHYSIPPVLVTLTAVAIWNLQEKAKSIFGPKKATWWPFRGLGGATYLICIATFATSGKTRFSSIDDGSSIVNPVYTVIVLVFSVALVFAALCWTVNLERRLSDLSGNHLETRPTS